MISCTVENPTMKKQTLTEYRLDMLEETVRELQRRIEALEQQEPAETRESEWVARDYMWR